MAVDARRVCALAIGVEPVVVAQAALHGQARCDLPVILQVGAMQGHFAGGGGIQAGFRFRVAPVAQGVVLGVGRVLTVGVADGQVMGAERGVPVGVEGGRFRWAVADPARAAKGCAGGGDDEGVGRHLGVAGQYVQLAEAQLGVETGMEQLAAVVAVAAGEGSAIDQGAGGVVAYEGLRCRVTVVVVLQQPAGAPGGVGADPLFQLQRGTVLAPGVVALLAEQEGAGAQLRADRNRAVGVGRAVTGDPFAAIAVGLCPVAGEADGQAVFQARAGMDVAFLHIGRCLARFEGIAIADTEAEFAAGWHAGDEIDHTTHRIATVQRRHRAEQDFRLLDRFGRDAAEQHAAGVAVGHRDAVEQNEGAAIAGNAAQR